MQAYITYMKSIVKELRPDLNDTYIAEEMNAAYDFEREIANVSLIMWFQRNNFFFKYKALYM